MVCIYKPTPVTGKSVSNSRMSALFCYWGMSADVISEGGRNVIIIRGSHSQGSLPSSDFCTTVNCVHWCTGTTGCPGILRSKALSSQVSPGDSLTLLFSGRHSWPDTRMLHFQGPRSIWNSLPWFPGATLCPGFCLACHSFRSSSGPTHASTWFR